MDDREPFSEETTTIWMKVSRVSDEIAEDSGEKLARKTGDWGMLKGFGMVWTVIRDRRPTVLAAVRVVGQESRRECQLVRGLSAPVQSAAEERTHIRDVRHCLSMRIVGLNK